jgi:hypothetical protein
MVVHRIPDFDFISSVYLGVPCALCGEGLRVLSDTLCPLGNLLALAFAKIYNL